MLRRAQVHHALGTRGRRHDADPAGPLEQYVAQLATPLDHIGQGEFWGQAQQNIDVRQPKVRVHQQNAPAQLGQCDGQVD